MSESRNAVFIGEQAHGVTVVIGREDKEEWIRQEVPPLFLDDMC